MIRFFHFVIYSSNDIDLLILILKCWTNLNNFHKLIFFKELCSINDCWITGNLLNFCRSEREVVLKWLQSQKERLTLEANWALIEVVTLTTNLVRMLSWWFTPTEVCFDLFVHSELVSEFLNGSGGTLFKYSIKEFLLGGVS